MKGGTMKETGKEKCAAILTIHNPAEMSPKGKKEVLVWLKKQVEWFEKDSELLGKTFCARYLYTEGDYAD
jgi:hypothetical protein